MESVKTKLDLKTSPHDCVYVVSLDRVYVRTDGEWVPKLYFTAEEVSLNTQIPVYSVLQWGRKLGMKTTRSQFVFDDIIKLMAVRDLRAQKKSIKEILTLV